MYAEMRAVVCAPALFSVPKFYKSFANRRADEVH